MIAMIFGVAGLAINLLGAILLATAQSMFFQTLSNMVYAVDATEEIRASGGPEVRFGGLALSWFSPIWTNRLFGLAG